MPGMPPPPTNIFKVPKIRPGNPNFKIKSTTSMAPTIQAAQPSQWDLASPGIPPMKTSSAYEYGQHEALAKLGLVKSAAVGIGGGFKGVLNAFTQGWGGKGAARAARRSSTSGGVYNAGSYMQGLMKSNPGTAASMIGLGAAGATGAAALGAHAMFGGGSSQQPTNVNVVR